MVTNNSIDLSSQGVAYYNGTGTFSGVDGGTSAQVLKSNGTGVAPSFQATGGGSAGMNGFVNTGLIGLQSNPADGTTYYLAYGCQSTSNTTNSLTILRYYATKSVTINSVYGIYQLNTPASAQNVTFFVRKNNTTNTNVTTSLQLTSTFGSFNGTSLGISLAAGDYITLGFTGPTWTSNPVAVEFAVGFSD